MQQVTISESAHIGYDGDIERLYLQCGDKYVSIDETEVGTVEKILEGLGIPFTERIGQCFWK